MRLNRATVVLGVLAAASLALAVWVNRPGEVPPADPERGQPLVPGGAELAAKTAEIQIVSGAVKTTLQKGEAGWTLLEKGGYPAEGRKVAALLDGLTRSEKVAPKSPDRARFDRLGLGAEGTSLSLYDGGRALLFALALGHQFSDPASGRLLTYAWFEGLPRAWTVSAFPPLDSDPMFWAAREVLAISPARIKRVNVAFGERESVSLSRAEASEFLFSPRELAGAAVNQPAVNALAFALAAIETEDVARAGGLELFEVATAVYTTFDGLELTVRFYDSDGVVWAAFAAEHKPAVLDEDDTPSVMPDVPPDTGEEAAALNARVEGWLYRLPLAKVSDILKTEDALRADAR